MGLGGRCCLFTTTAVILHSCNETAADFSFFLNTVELIKSFFSSIVGLQLSERYLAARVMGVKVREKL